MITNDQSGNNLSTFDLFILCLVFVVQQGTLQSVPPSLLSFLSLPLKYIQGVWISVLSTSFLCVFFTGQTHHKRSVSENPLCKSVVVVIDCRRVDMVGGGPFFVQSKGPFLCGGPVEGGGRGLAVPCPPCPPRPGVMDKQSPGGLLLWARPAPVPLGGCVPWQCCSSPNWPPVHLPRDQQYSQITSECKESSSFPIVFFHQEIHFVLILERRLNLFVFWKKKI